MNRKIAILSIFTCLFAQSFAQTLQMENELCLPLPSLWGEKTARTAREWEYARKPELLEQYSSQIYGRTPDGGGVAAVEVLTRNAEAFDGLATMSQVRITLAGPRGTKEAMLLLYVPNRATAANPAPVLMGYNFNGNHSTTVDATVFVSPGSYGGGPWDPEHVAERGMHASAWPVRIAVDRGYAVATMHYADIEVDANGRGATGVRGLFHSAAELERADSWGAIGAWAWGLSRILDVLTDVPEVDAARAIALGHSRLGKTALWAAAQDPRFAAVASLGSGCCGAALFRHDTGQSIAHITHYFPHWFAKNILAYANRDNLEHAGTALAALPIDQHHLLALIAPRPVFIGSVTKDAHRREFVSTLYASPIFERYGHSGTVPLRPGAVRGEDLPWQQGAAIQSPAAGQRTGGRLAFYLREGHHDVEAEDWRQIMDWAKELRTSDR